MASHRLLSISTLLISLSLASPADAEGPGDAVLDMAPVEALDDEMTESIQYVLANGVEGTSLGDTADLAAGRVPVFNRLVGWAKSIASSRNPQSSSGTIAAVASDGRIFRWNGQPWQWEQIGHPSTAKKVFVGSSLILRLLEDNTLEYFEGTKNGVWVWRSMGTLLDGSELNDPQVEVGPDGRIFYLTGKRDAVYRWYAMRWEKIGGPARKIAAGRAGLFAINPDVDQVWHYHRTPFEHEFRWELAFQFAASVVSDRDTPEDISMSFTMAPFPNGMFAVSPYTGEDYEDLWLKFPADYPFIPSTRVLRYNLGEEKIVDDFIIGQYESRNKVASQRDVDTMVSFYLSRNIYKLQTDESNGSASWPVVATLDTSSDRTLTIDDYVNTGGVEMVLASNGFIYMKSGETALASELSDEPQPAPVLPPMGAVLLGGAFFGIVWRKNR